MPETPREIPPEAKEPLSLEEENTELKERVHQLNLALNRAHEELDQVAETQKRDWRQIEELKKQVTELEGELARLKGEELRRTLAPEEIEMLLKGVGEEVVVEGKGLAETVLTKDEVTAVLKEAGISEEKIQGVLKKFEK